MTMYKFLTKIFLIILFCSVQFLCHGEEKLKFRYEPLDQEDINKIEKLGWELAGYYKENGKKLYDEPFFVYGFTNDEILDPDLELLMNIGSLWFFSTQPYFEEDLKKISITDQLGNIIFTKEIEKIFKPQKWNLITGGGIEGALNMIDIIKAIDSNPFGLLRLHYTHKTVYIPIKNYPILQNLSNMIKAAFNYDIYDTPIYNGNIH